MSCHDASPAPVQRSPPSRAVSQCSADYPDATRTHSSVHRCACPSAHTSTPDPPHANSPASSTRPPSPTAHPSAHHPDAFPALPISQTSIPCPCRESPRSPALPQNGTVPTPSRQNQKIQIPCTPANPARTTSQTAPEISNTF